MAEFKQMDAKRKEKVIQALTVIFDQMFDQLDEEIKKGLLDKKDFYRAMHEQLLSFIASLILIYLTAYVEAIKEEEAKQGSDKVAGWRKY